MKKRVYHGWIYIEKAAGLKDHFSVQYRDDDGVSQVKSIGYGKAAEAVDFFEMIRQIGRVQLESTPLGLRVFTEVSSVTTKIEMF